MQGRHIWKNKVRLALMISMFCVSGCEETRDILGMTKTAPDEFADCPAEQELTVPPCFDVLPEPQVNREADPFPESRPLSQANTPRTPGARVFLKKLNPTTTHPSFR